MKFTQILQFFFKFDTSPYYIFAIYKFYIIFKYYLFILQELFISFIPTYRRLRTEKGYSNKKG